MRRDIVVFYKIDRLTRSLADFAKIVEILDARGASFVSVTQQFNTTTSMGRLTLNVLLSFAQFEREVIGERIRDKIAASKQKGMWMGGVPPLVRALRGLMQPSRNFSSPVRQKLILQRPRCLAVGNVVDLTAECINRVHGLATMVWQELHSPEKRAAGGANASGDCVVLNVARCRYRGLVRC